MSLESNPATTKAWKERTQQKMRDNPKPRARLRASSTKRAAQNVLYTAARLTPGIITRVRPMRRNGPQRARNRHSPRGRAGRCAIDRRELVSLGLQIVSRMDSREPASGACGGVFVDETHKNKMRGR